MHSQLALARSVGATILLGASLLVAQLGVSWLAPALLGSALIGYGLDRLAAARRARAWIPVEAEILQSTVSEKFVGESVRYEYFPLVRFAYTTSSGKFTSDYFTPLRQDYAHYDRKYAEALAATYSPGALVTAYSNPAHPSQASLKREISRPRRNHLLAITLAGLLLYSFTLFAATLLRP